MLRDLNFSSLPVLVQVLAVNFLFLVAVVGVIVAAKNRFRFTGKNVAFSFGDGKTAPQSLHARCPHRLEVMSVIEKTWKHAWEKHNLKALELVKRQMDVAESSATAMMHTLMSTYCRALQGKGHTDPIQSQSCKSYRQLLGLVEHELLSEMRGYIRENHFAEKTEVQFESYLESRVDSLLHYGTELFNDMYFYTEDITRAELYEANRKIQPDLRAAVARAFHHARAVAVEIQIRIDEITREEQSLIGLFTNGGT